MIGILQLQNNLVEDEALDWKQLQELVLPAEDHNSQHPYHCQLQPLLHGGKHLSGEKVKPAMGEVEELCLHSP